MKLLKVEKKSAPKQSLWEILDYKVNFEILYSGVEPEEFYNTLYECGIRNFLLSYHYIQNKHLNMEKRFKGKNVRVFIDSGAHTYQQDPKYEEVSVNEWEEYLKRYIKWAEKNKEYIFAIANFDFENIVGGEKVLEWNKKYFEPFMLRTGIPVCFVWHQNSAEDWNYYCKRYPYVGFSSVNLVSGEEISLSEYKTRIKTAEKYGSVVHGFGMTKTSMLIDLPFYTADSTTWMVGLRYGEINYWNGNKMIRLRKDKWQGEMLDKICEKYGLNPDKLLAEEMTEMIKANIGAFIDATVFIKEHLKSQMYWLKAKVIKNSLDSLPPDFFPTPEWISTVDKASEEVKEYARKMNINPDLGNETFIYVFYMTIFLNWNNSIYFELKENLLEVKDWLSEIHDSLINKIRETDEERIQDLIQFFTDCLEGKNEFLLQIGTNFDRRQLEREEYIDDSDEDIEVIDVPESEVIRAFHALLPVPSDATEDKDEEITSNFDNLSDETYQEMGITPVRDDEGKVLRYVKRQVRKTIYSKKFPKFACDNCFVGAKCPEYKAGFVCAYSKIFKKFDTRNMTDIIQAVQSITGYDMERLQKAMIFEQLNGGIDGNVSAMIETNLRHLLLLKDLYANASAETIRQTKIIRADGSMESVTQVSNPQEGGILSKLLSGLSQQEKTSNEEIINPPKE